MKKYFFLIGIIFLILIGCSLPVYQPDDSITIQYPDPYFEQVIRKTINKPTGDIKLSDVINITKIDTEIVDFSIYINIRSLQGIEYCEKLKELDIYDTLLTTLDISKNINLEFIGCGFNEYLTNFDVSKNIKLKGLYCYQNSVSNLDITNNINLKLLSCAKNQINSLNVSNNINLIILECFSNQLTSLDVTNNINLEYLYCGYNQLAELDVTHNLNLKGLYYENNQLANLDLSKNIKLTNLSCYKNQMINLDISKNIELRYLWCNNNILPINTVTKVLSDMLNHVKNNNIIEGQIYISFQTPAAPPLTEGLAAKNTLINDYDWDVQTD